jgi:hypothetical protein
MLEFLSSTKLPVPVKMAGAEIERIAKHGSPTKKALLKVDLETGRVEPHHLTPQQAQAMAKPSYGYGNTATNLSADDLERVRRDEATLSHFHNNKKLTDKQVDEVVDKIGLDRIWGAIERKTKPTTEAVIEAVVKAAIAAE